MKNLLKPFGGSVSLWYVGIDGEVFSSDGEHIHSLFDSNIKVVEIDGYQINKDDNLCIVVRIANNSHEIKSSTWLVKRPLLENHTMIFLVRDENVFISIMDKIIEEVTDNAELTRVLKKEKSDVLLFMERTDMGIALATELEDAVLDYIGFYTKKPGSLESVWVDLIKPTIERLCEIEDAALLREKLLTAAKEYNGDVIDLVSKIEELNN
jgi:hypothetical protein